MSGTFAERSAERSIHFDAKINKYQPIREASFPLCVGEGDQQGDVPFGAITVFTVSVEEIPLVFILFDKVGAARRGVPK